MATSPLLELPPELRVRTYEYTLLAKGSLTPRRQSPPSHTGSEALDVMYKVNAISVPKATFCEREAACSRTVPNLELVVHLQVTNFTISAECMKEVVDGLKPCSTCISSISAVQELLGLRPRLRTIVFDYGSDESSQQAVQKFKASVRKQDGKEWSLACVDVGHHKLEGTATKNVEISFVYGELRTLWAAMMMEEEGRSSKCSKLVTVILQGLAEGIEEFGMKIKLDQLDTMHSLSVTGDADNDSLVPDVIAQVWPRGTPVDIRDSSLIRKLGIMEEFDGAVQEYVHRKPREGNWVLKR
ncbi:hypothetical protein LTR85_007516 [Meristemomyces frigidus]|nr:hypothetical protein LTR85_007516 [Meristemomyces frigidus]